MTRYLLGAILVSIVVFAIAAGARAVRSRSLPSTKGAPALLVDAALGLTAVVLLAEVLGAIGVYSPVPVILGSVLVGGAGCWWGHQEQPGEHPIQERRDASCAHSCSRGELLLCVAIVAVLVASWLAPTISALMHGITNVDSNWYHLPVAARFVQDGTVTHVQYLDGGPLTAFYPASTPLLHGIGMMLLGSDLLSPILNLGFLALTLLAGWCVGRPFGAAPIALAATSVALATPMLVTTQPGGAYNDIAGVGLFLVAIAILASAQPFGVRSGLIETRIAALAAGLAVGTKYQFILPGVALTIGVIMITPSRGRARRFGNWFVPLSVAGGFYYVRNLIVVGNPVPALDVHLGPVSLPSPPSGLDQLAPVTVLRNHALWNTITRPAFESAFGPLWFVLLALVVIGVVLTISMGRSGFTRMVGAIAAAALLAYAATPVSLGSSRLPIEFVFSLRYAALGVALALIGLALVPAIRRWSRYMLAFFAVFIGLTQLDPGIWPTDLRQNRFAEPAHGTASIVAIGLGAVVLVAGALLVITRERVPRPRFSRMGVALAAVALVVTGAIVHGPYLRNRYTDAPYLAGVYRWAHDVHGQRIAVVGTPLQYPLYGKDLTNHVQYVGQRTAHGGFVTINDCATWRRSLDAGNYRYVVTAPNPLIPKAPVEDLWTRTDPMARITLRDGFATVFELRGSLDPRGCDRLGSKAYVAAVAS